LQIEEKILHTGYKINYGNNVIELIKLDKGWYKFKTFRLENRNIKLIKEFRKKFYEFSKKEKFVIFVDNRYKEKNKFLSESGLKSEYSKHSFIKNLTNHKFKYKDDFKYFSFKDVGIERFFEIYRASADNPINNILRFKKYILRMKDENLNREILNYWKLILIKSKIIGFIMPFIIPENPESGTILNMGLLQEERGQGYGRIIHSKALIILKKSGVIHYKGSTESNNYAMIKIFKLNGCKKTGTINFYKAG
jgi:hypothetical protein